MEASSPSRECTDEQLVAATRAGDDRAFEQLYGRYQRRISAYVLGMVKDHQRAEDVTQEVFISALRRIRQTDRAIAFKPWIYEIAKNACIDQFRRSKRTDEVSCDAEEGVGPTLVSTGPTPDMALQSKQQLADLRGAFGGLSESHHRILVMRELEGLSYAEIGTRMGMTKPSVESTLFRARKRLSEEYDELVSGERCLRVQGIIARADAGRLGARDQRKMARHVSYCQPCRRAATVAGLGDLVPSRTGVRAKIAGLLPLPALVRDRWLGLGGHGAAHGDGGSPSGIAAWAHALLPAAESGGAGWAKLAATAATVAIAGFGAQQAVSGGGDEPAPEVAVAAAPVSAAKPVAQRRPSGADPASAPARGSDPASSGRRRAGRAAGGTTGRAARAGRRPTTSAATASRPAASSRGGRSTVAAGGGQASRGGGEPAAAAAGSAGSGPDRSGSGGGGGGGSGSPGRPAGGPLPSVGAVGDTAAKVPTMPDVTQAVGETVQDTTQSAGQAVEQITQAAGQAVQQTTDALGETVRETGSALGDTVRQTGDAVGGPVAPVTQAVDETARQTTGAVGSTVKAAGRAVDRTTSAAGSAVAGVTTRVGASAAKAVEDTTEGLNATLGGD